MTAILTNPPEAKRSGDETIADLLESLGVGPERVRMFPPPGTATVADVVEAEARTNRLCELVDGVLVEKAMGFKESLLAVYLITILNEFVSRRNLGVVTGADGMVQLFPNLVRMPDVAFTSWQRLSGKVPTEPAPLLAPDLAIEVLSPSNTKKEMNRKRGEYFEAGVRLVWVFHLDARTVGVYTSAQQPLQILGIADKLDGRDVLPGFEHPVADVFSRLDALPSPQS